MINFYRIVSPNTNKVYVGSTVKPIEARLQGHEAHYNLFQDGNYHYVTSFDILESQDFKIELIESKICETKEDRDTIERYHILNTPTAVNTHQPGRTKTQYYQDKKQDILEYYQENKQVRLDYKKQYYQNNKPTINQKHNCVCGGLFSKSHKTRHERTQKHINYLLQHP